MNHSIKPLIIFYYFALFLTQCQYINAILIQYQEIISS